MLTVPFDQLADGPDDVPVRLDAPPTPPGCSVTAPASGATASEQALLPARDGRGVRLGARRRRRGHRARAAASSTTTGSAWSRWTWRPTSAAAGWARPLVAALAGWGAEQGARRAYLQVAADNEPARALYERLGFTEHHTYHYVREP